MESFAADEYIL